MRNVVPGSPAERAGLTFSDEIVARRARVTAATSPSASPTAAPVTQVRVTYFRRDELREATLVLVESPERKLVLSYPTPRLTRAQGRSTWLAGSDLALSKCQSGAGTVPDTSYTKSSNGYLTETIPLPSAATKHENGAPFFGGGYTGARGEMKNQVSAR